MTLPKEIESQAEHSNFLSNVELRFDLRDSRVIATRLATLAISNEHCVAEGLTLCSPRLCP